MVVSKFRGGRVKLINKIVIALALVLSIQGAALAEQVDKEKDAAIQQYLKVAPVDTMLSDALGDFLKQAPPDTQQAIEETFKIIDKKKISDAMVESLRKHLTTSEIKALTKFYGSADGKSIMRKMSIVQAEIIPVLQAEMTAAMIKVYESQKKKE